MKGLSQMLIILYPLSYIASVSFHWKFSGVFQPEPPIEFLICIFLSGILSTIVVKKIRFLRSLLTPSFDSGVKYCAVTSVIFYISVSLEPFILLPKHGPDHFFSEFSAGQHFVNMIPMGLYLSFIPAMTVCGAIGFVIKLSGRKDVIDSEPLSSPT